MLIANQRNHRSSLRKRWSSTMQMWSSSSRRWQLMLTWLRIRQSLIGHAPTSQLDTTMRPSHPYAAGLPTTLTHLEKASGLELTLARSQMLHLCLVKSLKLVMNLLLKAKQGPAKGRSLSENSLAKKTMQIHLPRCTPRLVWRRKPILSSYGRKQTQSMESESLTCSSRKSAGRFRHWTLKRGLLRSTGKYATLLYR